MERRAMPCRRPARPTRRRRRTRHSTTRSPAPWSTAPARCRISCFPPDSPTRFLSRPRAGCRNSPDSRTRAAACFRRIWPLLTTGSTGLASNWPDTRINNYGNLPSGVYPLVTATGQSLYDTYGGSPVHRFYQMWQQLDCDAGKATPRNPSGCLADLFPWVEMTVAAGSNGNPPFRRRQSAEGRRHRHGLL